MATNQWTDDDDDFDIEDNQPQYEDGSELLKKLRKAKRADEKRIKELSEQLESLSKAQRERTVKEVLEKHGVTTKAARLIMKDIEDVSEESVYNYLVDNADVFGLEVQTTQVDTAKQANLAELRQQDMVTQGAQAPDRNMDANRMIDEAGSADEIIRMIQSGQF